MGPSSLPVQPRLKIGSSENLSRIPGIPLSRKTPALPGRPGAGQGNGVSASANVRSISAIDLQAANRAVRNVRGAYVPPLRKHFFFYY